MASIALARSYGRLKQTEQQLWQDRYKAHAHEVGQCGSYLQFLEADGKKRLHQAYFCRNRLCGMCNWRKAIKTLASVSKVMDVVESENPDIQPVFLTLTQKNCAFDDLRAEIGRISEGFRRLFNNRVVEQQAVGWFRALEVTYNRQDDTWHPHLHVVLLFDKKYFSKTNKRYLTHAEWVRLWRLSMRLDYDPSVRISRAKAKDGKKRSAIAEVAKYTLKDKELLTKDQAATDRLVDCLTRSLHGKRLFAFGGLMAKVAKRLKADRPDEGDLVHIQDDEQAMRADVAYALIAYRWDFGLRDYFKVP